VTAVNANGYMPFDFIDGVSSAITLSQKMKNRRIIHQIPGSPEYRYYIKLYNIGVELEEAITLTMEEFPSLTELSLLDDRQFQPHHDVNHTKELTQYVTKKTSNDQLWGALKSDQTKHLSYVLFRFLSTYFVLILYSTST